LSVVVVNFIGRGLTLPFQVVYLHQVRGFALGTTGVLIGAMSLVGFLVVGPGGAAIDRYGARRVMQAAQLLLVASDIVLAFASTIPVATVAMVLAGVSFGVVFPASQTLIATVIPVELRQRYFGLNFTLLNLGIGIGGILGGVFVDVHRLVTFQAIYLIDGLSLLPSIALLAGPLRHIAGRPTHGPELPKASYREVLRKPAVPTLLVLTFVGSFVGYAQFNAGMPAYATTISKVSTGALGFAFACNTAVIVVLQLFVLQRIEGRRRTRVIAVMGLVWAASWLLLGASGLVPGTVGAAVLVCGCGSVFAFGETLLQPTIPAIVNDLADEHLRGRFNALNAAAFQFPGIIGPPVAGALIGAGLGWVFIALLIVGCALIGLLSIGRLEPLLTPTVNGVRVEEPEPAVAA
jgi:MFS family permease